MRGVRGLLQSLGGYQPWSDIWARSGWMVQQRHETNEVRVLDAQSRVVFTGDRSECVAYAFLEAPSLPSGPVVILLHGLGCGRLVMSRMESGLRNRGFSPVNVGYPSLREDVAYHAAAVESVALGLTASGATEVHWVVHSLGGLVALAALSQAKGWKPGRCVLIGSPVQGAAFAGILDKLYFYEKLVGPCWQAVLPRTVKNLNASKTSLIVPGVSIGVIAGGNGRRGYNRLLEGDNDGTVRVEETRLPGMEDDFLLIPALHSSLPMRTCVVNACANFLLSGRFGIDSNRLKA